MRKFLATTILALPALSIICLMVVRSPKEEPVELNNNTPKENTKVEISGVSRNSTPPVYTGRTWREASQAL